MGTAKFLVYMTVFVVVWILLNLIGIFGLKWDPCPFILLNLFFSTQASYSAPLILLAQNRQERRDQLSLEEDRRMRPSPALTWTSSPVRSPAIRMHLGELATRLRPWRVAQRTARAGRTP